MTSEDVTDEWNGGSTSGDSSESGESSDVRERLDAGRERAVEGFDEGVVDVLSWVLDTETRARIYVHLRKHPDSTSDEVAEGTGLYPSTVREALAELHDEGTVERGKRESDGAGNNPYEYRAISPSELVSGAIEDVQDSLNAVFQLDRYLGGEETSDEAPVTITVEEAADDQELGEPAGETGGGESDEEREAAEDDADNTVGDDLADSVDEEAVEAGEAASAKAEGGTEGESDEATGDRATGDEDDENVEESL